MAKTSPQSQSAENRIKRPKPKILLIDVGEKVGQELAKAGYNVSFGTFGMPYRVQPSGGTYQVNEHASVLPNLAEQEIVVVDAGIENADGNPSRNPATDGMTATFQSAHSGMIDPRPLGMTRASNAMGHLLQHGSVFIVFSSASYHDEYIRATMQYGSPSEQSRWKASNWSFLEILRNLAVSNISGDEVSFEKGGLAELLAKGGDGVSYRCTFKPIGGGNIDFIPLAKNKYGDTVSALLRGREAESGIILILPKMPRADRIFVELFESYVAQWRPDLFHHLEGENWLHDPRYELPAVIALKAEIGKVQLEANSAISLLNEQIGNERAKQQNIDRQVLLTGTGDALVQSLIRVLLRLGFKDVRDVDADATDANDTGPKREDIQIRDRELILVVDVKGVSGHPEHGESMQAEKHAGFRRRDWNRGTVQGLMIVNHQRHLPPHERDKRAYDEEIIKNAEESRSGLMTTLDVLDLLENAERLGWAASTVQDVFYQTGRVEPIPSHYSPAGDVVKVLKKATAIGVNLSKDLPRGSKLAVRAGKGFIEFTAASLQLDDESVELAPAGSVCGISCKFTSEIKEKMPVFLVGTLYPVDSAPVCEV